MNSRTRIFLVAATVCVIGASAYVWRAAGRAEPSALDRAEPRFTWIDGIPSRSSGLFFVSPAADRSFKKFSFVASEELDGSRYVTTMRCERAYMRGGKGLCANIEQDGLSARHIAYIFDGRFLPEQRLPLTGIPSRIRVSADGTLGAITVFESGHSYADAGFSTRTTLVDMSGGRLLGDLEQFRIQRDGQEFKAVDFNFWGVTFIPGTRRFYVTLGTRGSFFLVEGDVDRRSGVVVRDGIECPSLSPDGSLTIAFKKRVNTSTFGLGWTLAVLDLASGRETVLDAEMRSIDDQVEWLDGEHVLYFLPSQDGNNLWALNVSNREPPRIYLKDAYSPAVLRN